MTGTERQRLVEKAKQILQKNGIFPSSYDNIYPVEVNDTPIAVHVVRFEGSEYEAGSKKQMREQQKKVAAQFKRAARAFKSETGIFLRMMWH